MNPKVDPNLCIGCGLCSSICPDVFELGSDGLAHVKNPDGCQTNATCCQEAADSCPVNAISL